MICSRATDHHVAGTIEVTRESRTRANERRAAGHTIGKTAAGCIGHEPLQTSKRGLSTVGRAVVMQGAVGEWRQSVTQVTEAVRS